MGEVVPNLADVLWLYWAETKARFRRKVWEILDGDSPWLWVINGAALLAMIVSAIGFELGRRDRTGRPGLERLLEYIELTQPRLLSVPLQAIAYIAGSALVAVLRCLGTRDLVEFNTAGHQ